MDYDKIQSLPREKLIELCEVYAKNWLAIDGLWFQAVESGNGMDQAMAYDEAVWRRFTEIEARRIKGFLGLAEFAGLEGLRRALAFRLYAPLNRDECVMEGEHSMTYYVHTCRVQQARERKGLPLHPCRPVGLVEYTHFAKVIDPRIQTQVVSCYPEITQPASSCVWKFTL